MNPDIAAALGFLLGAGLVVLMFWLVGKYK
jgi:hypothetical protein